MACGSGGLGAMVNTQVDGGLNMLLKSSRANVTEYTYAQ